VRELLQGASCRGHARRSRCLRRRDVSVWSRLAAGNRAVHGVCGERIAAVTTLRIPHVRRAGARVSLEECERRALAYLDCQYSLSKYSLSKAAFVAHAIWPDAKWIAAQGAGGKRATSI
jgi:hypothetical protein